MANDKDAKASSTFLTPPFRVSFPSVFEKSAFRDGKPRFSLAGLFFPKGCATAPAWTDGDKSKWQAIRKQLDVVSIEAFKKPMKDLPRDYKLPVHKGDEKTYEGYGDPNMFYFTMANSMRRPQIIDAKTGNYITAENAEEFYAGCWARASVRPYAFDNIGKGIAIGLGNLKKLKDDKSFEGFTNADDDFSGEDEDFAGAGSDDDDFGIGGGSDEDDPTA